MKHTRKDRRTREPGLSGHTLFLCVNWKNDRAEYAKKACKLFEKKNAISSLVESKEGWILSSLSSHLAYEVELTRLMDLQNWMRQIGESSQEATIGEIHSENASISLRRTQPPRSPKPWSRASGLRPEVGEKRREGA